MTANKAPSRQATTEGLGRVGLASLVGALSAHVEGSFDHGPDFPTLPVEVWNQCVEQAREADARWGDGA